MKIGSLEISDFPLLLAPMEDVSDPPFRALCKRYGADLLFTEFISSEGLIRQAAKSVKKLDIFNEERPVGIQIFGGELEPMLEAALIAEAAGPDLIDINFGCPIKKVVTKGAGAAILKDIPKMARLAEAIVNAISLPVTVKTRLGWDQHAIQIEEVAERLQDAGIKALSIHCRTRSQMYKGSADWTWIRKIKDNPRITIPVFGNGDIDTPQQAIEARQRYHPDGIMIGRASIGRPWIFRQIKAYLNEGILLPDPSLAERVSICREHLLRSIEWKGEKLGILEMRRHYARYFRGYRGVKPFRNRLVTLDRTEDVLEVLDELAAAGLEKAEPATA